MNSDKNFNIDLEYSRSESKSTDHISMGEESDSRISLKRQVVAGNFHMTTVASVPSKISFH